ncbi:MAG: (5-formylfuran-3-yl)methyl phosphate synthase [Burkholderiales bacterium]
MTGMLASVATPAEAEIVLAEAVDIIDLKNPDKGALGNLPFVTISRIVRQVNGARPVSATIGDLLDMDPRTVCERVRRTADTGVDFVKVGLFPASSLAACVDALGNEAQRGTRLVAVLLADLAPPMQILHALSAHGFTGAMLDTAGKHQGSLTSVMALSALEQFVKHTRDLGLLSGLAGSLRLPDIAPLSALAPDYLGFRGALCQEGLRTRPLSRASVSMIRRELDHVRQRTHTPRISNDIPLASKSTAVTRVIC